ncbi:MAG: asparagine synthase (glutamine-hydrolyzing) [Acidobacteria bacterium]|nr:MAG: asparagine synthase (glutamine-hydrolyzing) [Acidobacteriota bacterium]
MCGITGYWDYRNRDSAAAMSALVRSMSSRLAHRGPDGEGDWVDATAGVALGHRRLALLDLSDAGKQPMISASGRFVLVLNGEIYNFAELRAELESQCQFRGHSDTEVLLAAVETWGLEQALKRSVGMFAIAVWDRQERALTLARDRLGEKPLYYAQQEGVLFFGSELKAFSAHPRWRPRIDQRWLREYLRYGYIPWPGSIFQDCQKLPPGTFLRVQDIGSLPAPEPYWSLDRVVAETPIRSFLDPEEAVDELELRLRNAIAGQMVADVPVGAFLSGGIDSSTIVALMQAQSSRRVRTFTIGFHERGFNEAEAAHAVATHLGTDHTELYLTAQDCFDLIPRLPTLYDEPFADSSQIPTALVSALARQQVTACLSGDGGDELLGGYSSYDRREFIWSLVRYFPPALRRSAGRLVTLAARGVHGFSPRYEGGRLAAFLDARSAVERHQATLSQFLQPDLVLVDPPSVPELLREPPPRKLDLVETLMYLDTLTYLPDDILVKVDRAAMATSLETRVPLLDHRVVEFVWSLPYALKRQKGKSKWLLREVLNRYVPASLVDRPKMGFGVPVGEWIRGPLRVWAEDLLAEDRIRQQGILRPEAVQALWQKHLAGADCSAQLWIVLMFQAWLQAQHMPIGLDAALAVASR